MLMCPKAIAPLCSLFPARIFADMKRDSAIEKWPSRLIADYFPLSRCQLALTDGLLSFIDQPG
jgi:hypothetical protein